MACKSVECAGIASSDTAHVWHPYTQHRGAPPPVPIVRGEGALLFDDTGRPIVDAISSWWVTTHGHGHPGIARAIAAQAEQLEQVIFTGFTHAPAAMLATDLTGRLPDGLTRVFYSDDGSTAVEVAIKIAFQYWSNVGERRTHIAALAHAYHGDTFGAMSASAPSMFTAPFADNLFEVIRLPAPDSTSVLGALDQVLDSAGDTVAALIIEPLLQGAGGMRMWDPETLRGMRARTAARGVLLIADEVLTGFGRTGPLFACQAAGVSPDIICLSKGLTGGFLPLGATVVREEIFAAFASADWTHTLFHGHSYTANPLACAAARASLALLDDESSARRCAIERQHRARLARVRTHARVGNARVLGTVAAFDIAGDAGYLNPIGRALSAFALKAGVLLRPLGNVVYVLPPYCITEEQLDLVYDTIEQFLERDPASS